MGTVTRGVITQVLSYCAGTTESHIRASGRGRRGRGAREKQGEYTSSCTYKALASVYITYVVQFHDVSLQFRRRIFHHYPYFSPRVSSTPRSSYPLPPSQFLSPSLSLVSFHYLPPAPSSPASGMAHHFVNQDKLEISSREIQPRYRLRLGGIYWATTVYPVVPTRY